MAELGHSDRLKMYVDPSKIYVDVHSNDLFSETTPSVILKFHMQHDQAARLQSDQIQALRKSKEAAVAKNN